MKGIQAFAPLLQCNSYSQKKNLGYNQHDDDPLTMMMMMISNTPMIGPPGAVTALDVIQPRSFVSDATSLLIGSDFGKYITMCNDIDSLQTFVDYSYSYHTHSIVVNLLSLLGTCVGSHNSIYTNHVFFFYFLQAEPAAQTFEPQVNTPALFSFAIIAVVFTLLQIRINSVRYVHYFEFVTSIENILLVHY